MIPLARKLFMAWLVALAFVAAAQAEEVYYRIPLEKLSLTDAKLPTGTDIRWRHWNKLQAMQPYAIVAGAAEVYVTDEQPANRWERQPLGNSSLYLRIARADELKGTLFVPRDDASGMERIPFTAAPADFSVEREAFLRGKLAYYSALRSRELAGAAWFRYQARQIAAEIGENAADDAARARRFDRGDDLSDTFALFSGGRAISENLQLDRPLLPSTRASETMVKLDSLAGITTREMDWKPLVKDLKPSLDPLAPLIPADQHVFFFPTFESATTMIDRAQQLGTMMLLAAESGSEDALTQQRYERQLCLPLTTLGRLLGPQLISSVAVTGSDPYLRTGSDVAVLFEARNATALSKLLAAQVALALQADRNAKSVSGQINGVSYSGAVTPGRTISTYSATLGDTVVVTNSLAQLRRIIGAHQESIPVLAGLDEYIFFRDRYRLGDKSETGLLILSDATIRRWCGPKWRIADSRRTRAAALMSDYSAAHAADLISGKLSATSAGDQSVTYGTLEFMTPIAELEFQEVPKDEADAYTNWRNNYQRNWRQFFDPIACRFSLKDDGLGIDVTIMPLIASTEYRRWVEITSGASLKPGSADPHDAIAHLAFAVNPDSGMIRSYGRMMQNISGNLRIEPLAWLGSAVALYADDDPFWAELAASKNSEEFMRKNYSRLPVALYAESRNALHLAGFLTALRAFVEQAAPGLTQWETLQHGDRPYAKITANAGGQPDQALAIYYAATPKALIISLNENVLKRAIDRQPAATQPAAASQPAAPAHEWLGQNLALHVSRSFVEAFQSAINDDLRTEVQLRAWSNLPILNEWRRMFPDRDPIEVHHRLFHTRLVDPSNGKYVWNDTWQTMESTTLGHPGEPREGPAIADVFGHLGGDFGLTFEHSGVRARASLSQTTEPK